MASVLHASATVVAPAKASPALRGRRIAVTVSHTGAFGAGGRAHGASPVVAAALGPFKLPIFGKPSEASAKEILLK